MTWVRDRRLDPAEDPDRWVAALRRARIPDRFWSADIEKVKGNVGWIRSALANVEKWAGQGNGFYINGPFNTGKSAAAALLAMEFIRRCHVVVWLSVREVPGVRFHEGELAAVDALLQRADVLVLDDLGSEKFRMTSAAGGALEEVVRIMYERQRAVIFTSNKGWPEFPHTYATTPGFVSVVQRISIPVALIDPWNDTPNMRFS